MSDARGQTSDLTSAISCWTAFCYSRPLLLFDDIHLNSFFFFFNKFIINQKRTTSSLDRKRYFISVLQNSINKNETINPVIYQRLVWPNLFIILMLWIICPASSHMMHDRNKDAVDKGIAVSTSQVETK